MPPAKNKFHTSFFQLYLKNEISAGKHAAQMCRKLEERPNTRLPRINSTGTISPMSGPDIHHGHGCLMTSIISFDFRFLSQSHLTPQIFLYSAVWFGGNLFFVQF